MDLRRCRPPVILSRCSDAKVFPRHFRSVSAGTPTNPQKGMVNRLPITMSICRDECVLEAITFTARDTAYAAIGYHQGFESRE